MAHGYRIARTRTPAGAIALGMVSAGSLFRSSSALAIISSQLSPCSSARFYTQGLQQGVQANPREAAVSGVLRLSSRIWLRGPARRDPARQWRLSGCIPPPPLARLRRSFGCAAVLLSGAVALSCPWARRHPPNTRRRCASCQVLCQNGASGLGLASEAVTMPPGAPCSYPCHYDTTPRLARAAILPCTHPPSPSPVSPPCTHLGVLPGARLQVPHALLLVL